MIDDILTKKSLYESELYNLPISMNFEPVIKERDYDFNEKKLENVISQYFKHFQNAKSIKAKRQIRKIIGELLDKKIEIESKYTYGYCSNMQEVLTIIRNCFSHIGRINIGKDSGLETNIVLIDYDSNNEKSGEVICKYEDLIELLRDPYTLPEHNNTLK